MSACPSARRPHTEGWGRRACGAVLAWAIAVAGCSPEPETRTADAGFKMLVKPAATAQPTMPDPAIWETPLADADLERGRVVWSGTCIQCHSTGLGGAPLIGNRALWTPRIAQGLDTLVEHATNGFYGKKGEMPARGGNAELSDRQVRLAVRFMVSRVEPGAASPQGS